MSPLKQLWTKIALYAEVLEGADDPKGEYIMSLGRRVDALERNMKHLESQLHTRPRSTT